MSKIKTYIQKKWKNMSSENQDFIFKISMPKTNNYYNGGR